MNGGARLFSIPAGAPFLDALAASILSGKLTGGARPSPLELTDYTIFLPNRSARDAMRGAFLTASGEATLLPKLRVLGAEDEEHEFFAPSPGDLPVISGLERQMGLASLILAWSREMAKAQPEAAEAVFQNLSPGGAAGLAEQFMQLIDQAQSEGVDLRGLADCNPQSFARHWEMTADFLKIASVAWPQFLRVAGVEEPVARRNRRLMREAERLLAAPDGPPVIIAGSTGSIPATASLMRAALACRRGAVVLPGVDLDMDAAEWAGLAARPEHPQHSFVRLLDTLGFTREQMSELCAASPIAVMRQTLLREALRPPETMAAWPAFIASANREALREAFAEVSLIAAQTPHDEAGAIALIIREAAETPGRTAALVTPDKRLARQVSALLKRWDISVGSGAAPLSSTPAGVLLALILDTMEDDAAPAILALLQHPLARLDMEPGAARAASETLDLALFRLPGRSVTIATLKAAMRRARAAPPGYHPAMRRLTPEDWIMTEDVCAKLAFAFAPLLSAKGSQPVATFARAHLETAQRLAGEVESAAYTFLARLAALEAGPEIALSEYPALYRTLAARQTAPDAAPHPRFFIWEPLDARLRHADVMIIGGLNEGLWPQAAEPNPWLNRAMQATLGFEPPERRLGQSAHGFCEAMGAPRVILTRSEKDEGAPTVPTRWLVRVQALLSGLGMDDALTSPQSYAAWARDLYAPERRAPTRQPRPCPPVAARPRALSVTAVEKFLASPYAIYAEHILGLKELPSLAQPFSNADKGQIIHAALSRFAERHPEALPSDIAGELCAVAEWLMDKLGEDDGARAFWRPRFRRFAGWFAETEAARRAGAGRVLAEVKGHVSFAAPAGEFTLNCRADRIDVTPHGVRIYDYKSGAMPERNAVEEGRAPQLALEAWIAEAGGFDSLPASHAAKLAHISAKGGEPPGDERAYDAETAKRIADAARDGLIALIAAFDRAETPYTATRRAAFAGAYRFDAYHHLARIAEWSAGEAAEE